MIYRDIAEKRKIEPGTQIWACAYEFDNSKMQMRFIQKPVFGEIDGDKWGRGHYFIPYKKNGKDLATSKRVSIESRQFADTYEECVGLYNRLVQDKIDMFMKRVGETRADFIEICQ